MRIKIGTRGSKMALFQADLVAQALKQSDLSIEPEIIVIKNRGDVRQGTPEAALVDKRKWMHELEEALLSKQIDISCNSAKDIPTEIDVKTQVVSVLKREDARDALVFKSGTNINNLNQLQAGAVLGTASLRRKAQLLSYRNDFKIIEHRGNVNTRIQKLTESKVLEAIVLAVAGLKRLNVSDESYVALDYETMLPAVNQGTLAVQLLNERTDLLSKLSVISDSNTQSSFIAERSCVAHLGAGCHSAVGVLGEIFNSEIKLTAKVYAADGSKVISSVLTGAVGDELELGKLVAKELIKQGAKNLL